ncbi:MAG: hypothetical protein ACOVQ4_20160 [Flectobacillus sp.]|uniref:hypothetical protein n=1 Tax=Flectobacillus sp. TaxID=50419 RepID=UPI003B9CE0DE
MVHEAPVIEQEEIVSERIEVGMPMILPYTFDFHNRVEGRALVEHDGKFYSVVEKIYRNDSLITVLQLNEKATKKIKQIAQELQSESGQIPSPVQKALALCKHLLIEYLPTVDYSTISFGNSPLFIYAPKTFHYVSLYHFSYYLKLLKPPCF